MERTLLRRVSMAAAVTSMAANPASVFGPLKQLWQVHTGAPIAATPAVAQRTVFVGSWDGYEYALRENTGRRLWRTNLGRTFDDNCGKGLPTLGITSAARPVGADLYVGGGDWYWYALKVASGRKLWRVSTAPNRGSGGYYNWASPSLYRGSAYVGISSQCDDPLTQGALMRVSLSAHRVKKVWKVVRDGQLGGGIWTTPVIDPHTGTVFVTTGTRVSAGQRYAESVVALDAKTLRIKGHWALPLSDPTPDADWGSSPTLFTDSHGRRLVAAVNKNGILYAFLRNRLGGGPVWETQIAFGGQCPQCGEGSTSNGFFDGKRLYFAGGNMNVHGQTYPGSVAAIDPATGKFRWQLGLPSEVLAALTGAHGMIVVPAAYGGLYVIDAASGKVLHANLLRGGPGYQPIYGAPKIADGRVFIGTTDGVIHAFRFPGRP
jgi:polyvinyl alcohol dehydrogenase (cytochrome)